MAKQHQPLVGNSGTVMARDEFRTLIADALKWPIPKLEKLTQLAMFPGIPAKVKQHTAYPFPLGSALRELFDEAVNAITHQPRDGAFRE